MREISYGILAGMLSMYVYVYHGAEINALITDVNSWSDSAVEGAGKWN